MKKMMILLTGCFLLAACNEDLPATADDGISPIDSNAGLADTPYYRMKTAPIDTSKGESRVDISKRDTFED